LRQAGFRASFDAFCVYLSSVLRIKFSGKNPARTQSRKPLCATAQVSHRAKHSSAFNQAFLSCLPNLLVSAINVYDQAITALRGSELSQNLQISFS
jgi:hypothetical protein